MRRWFQKQTAFAGSAFFRGNWPLRKEEFYSLRRHGIEITEQAAVEDAIWNLQLHHPNWGTAQMVCFRNMALPPLTLIDWDVGLIDSEKEAVKSCQCTLSIYSTGSKQNVLQDRKNGLRYLHLALGEEGVAAVDHVSQKFWSKEALDIEMSHDAELDIESLFTLHVVSRSESEKLWIHTHGLGEMGYFDFDIVEADSSYAAEGYDYLRSLAFQVLEEEAKPGHEVRVAGGRSVLLVPAPEFMKNSSEEHTVSRDGAEESHSENRVVLCEPAKSGIFNFGKKYQPAKIFTDPVDDRNSVPFSNEASALMQRRAQATYGFLREVQKELAQFQFPVLVKLGYEAAEKGDDGREYLWFEAHELKDNSIDATLLNEPFKIPSMKAGDRSSHPLERLTDWQIMTHGLGINPRQTGELRWIRENKEQLRTAMLQSEEGKGRE